MRYLWILVVAACAGCIRDNPSYAFVDSWCDDEERSKCWLTVGVSSVADESEGLQGWRIDHVNETAESVTVELTPLSEVSGNADQIHISVVLSESLEDRSVIVNGEVLAIGGNSS